MTNILISIYLNEIIFSLTTGGNLLDYFWHPVELNKVIRLIFLEKRIIYKMIIIYKYYNIFEMMGFLSHTISNLKSYL